MGKPMSKSGPMSPILSASSSPPASISRASEILGLKKELARALGKLSSRIERNQLAYYDPSPPQQAFHDAGATFRERLLMAANQTGKTYCGAREVAMHLTGRYPDDWKGKRFAGATVWLAGSETAELTRRGVQRHLVGPPADENAWGTAAIPAECIVETKRASGSVADALEYCTVRHVSGALSVVYFKNYAQGRKRWQADTVHGVWFDEEPPLEIYTEGLTRTNIHMGPVLVTFTPLMGQSQVVIRYIRPDPKDLGSRQRCVVSMTLDNSERYSAEEIEQIVASYPEHERDARTKGIPALGSGLVWPFHEQDYLVDPFEIPQEWPTIGGMDFGYDHPFGAALLRHNRDADIVYVTRTFRVRLKSPMDHVAALRTWDRPGMPQIPWAWPHDGRRRDKDPSGEEFASLYRQHGLDMLPDPATFEEGGNGLEAGVMEIYDRIASGRWKVLRGSCPEWIEEQRGYHRKDGLIQAIGDDVLSASRYGCMMKRDAKVLRPRRSGASYYNR